MPSLIGTDIAANYRKVSPTTKFGTRELTHALVTVATVDLTDTTTPDGNFARAIQAIQTIAEVYAVGQPTFGAGSSNFTVILSKDTNADSTLASAGSFFTDNGNATTIDAVLTALFSESVSVTYSVMYGLAYD